MADLVVEELRVGGVWGLAGLRLGQTIITQVPYEVPIGVLVIQVAGKEVDVVGVP